MRARKTLLVALMAGGTLVTMAVIGWPHLSAQMAANVEKVDMGDYEAVVPWPQPLPDSDLSHDGWTWGSGAGVWAESPDKVWVAQRGEIQLPPGATPWICPCLLDAAAHQHGPPAVLGQGATPTRCGGTTWCSRSIATATRSRSGCSTTTIWRRRAARDSARSAAVRTSC